MPKNRGKMKDMALLSTRTLSQQHLHLFDKEMHVCETHMQLTNIFWQIHSLSPQISAKSPTISFQALKWETLLQRK